jgi:hypothetical protein
MWVLNQREKYKFWGVREQGAEEKIGRTKDEVNGSLVSVFANSSCEMMKEIQISQWKTEFPTDKEVNNFIIRQQKMLDGY